MTDVDTFDHMAMLGDFPELDLAGLEEWARAPENDIQSGKSCATSLERAPQLLERQAGEYDAASETQLCVRNSQVAASVPHQPSTHTGSMPEWLQRKMAALPDPGQGGGDLWNSGTQLGAKGGGPGNQGGLPKQQMQKLSASPGSLRAAQELLCSSEPQRQSNFTLSQEYFDTCYQRVKQREADQAVHSANWAGDATGQCYWATRRAVSQQCGAGAMTPGPGLDSQPCNPQPTLATSPSPLLPGQLVFCATDDRGGISINWQFTHAYSQLTDEERRGQAYLLLKAEAGNHGLHPLVMRSMPTQSGTISAYSEQQACSYGQVAPTHVPEMQPTAKRGSPGVLEQVVTAQVRDPHPQLNSPSQQESFSAQNSALGDPKPDLVLIDGKEREAAQESMVGNASFSGKKHQRSTDTVERSKRVTLQLTPLDDETRAMLQNSALIPSLELVCRSRKELSQVLSHLQARWELSCPSAPWPKGPHALKLFPTAAMPILAGASWGPPDMPETLTIADLHMAMGYPEVVPLHYRWQYIGEPKQKLAEMEQLAPLPTGKQPFGQPAKGPKQDPQGLASKTPASKLLSVKLTPQNATTAQRSGADEQQEHLTRDQAVPALPCQHKSATAQPPAAIGPGNLEPPFGLKPSAVCGEGAPLQLAACSGEELHCLRRPCSAARRLALERSALSPGAATPAMVPADHLQPPAATPQQPDAQMLRLPGDMHPADRNPQPDQRLTASAAIFQTPPQAQSTEGEATTAAAQRKAAGSRVSELALPVRSDSCETVWNKSQAKALALKVSPKKLVSIYKTKKASEKSAAKRKRREDENVLSPGSQPIRSKAKNGPGSGEKPATVAKGGRRAKSDKSLLKRSAAEKLSSESEPAEERESDPVQTGEDEELRDALLSALEADEAAGAGAAKPSRPGAAKGCRRRSSERSSGALQLPAERQKCASKPLESDSSANADAGAKKKASANPKSSSKRRGENAVTPSPAKPRKKAIRTLQAGRRGTKAKAPASAMEPGNSDIRLQPGVIPEDRTCDGFGAWAAFSRQKRLAEEPQAAAPSTLEGNHLMPVPESTGQPDVSLGAWELDKGFPKWQMRNPEEAEAEHLDLDAFIAGLMPPLDDVSSLEPGFCAQDHDIFSDLLV